MLESILLSSAFAGGVTALLLFVFRNWILERLRGSIKYEYDQKLEGFKAQLNAQNDAQLEQIRARLQIDASERSIRLNRVFERTVDTIAGTYEHLLAIQDAAQEYTSLFEWDDSGSKEERRLIVADKLKAFRGYYRSRRPFLPKSTVDRINALLEKIQKVTFDFMRNVERPDGDRDDRAQRSTQSWVEADRIMMNETPALLAHLEDDLRKILGIYEEHSPTSTENAR